MATKDEKNQFSEMIEKLAVKLDCTHMDAIVEHCNATGFEVEVAATLINPILKSKIESEARNLRYLAKVDELPI